MEITRYGLNLFASTLYLARRQFGTIEDLLSWFFDLYFGLSPDRMSDLERGVPPSLSELDDLVDMAKRSTIAGKLINNKTGNPFTKEELVDLLQELEP